MTEPADTRADITRQAILDAASRQFAERSFSSVSLDDIVADTDVSKSALYFHFRSKHSLALAIIEHHAAEVRAATMELLTHQRSGLETMIEITFMVAALDARDPYARAAMNLIGEVRAPGSPPVGLVDEWMKGSITVLEQAIADGDVRSDCDPEDLARVLVAHYVGVRQISDFNHPAAFLTDIGNSWRTTLPGFANPDRIDYLTEFVERRAVIAIRNLTERG
jgi:TetR/AcrR family transcriptional regulator, transcriptional repressor for nem operon